MLLLAPSAAVIATGTGLLGFNRVERGSARITIVQPSVLPEALPEAAPLLSDVAVKDVVLDETERPAALAPAASASSAGARKKVVTPRIRKAIGPVEREL